MHAAARLSLAAIALFMLVACGGAPAPDEEEAAAAKAEAEDLGRSTDATVLDDMIQTQDKARAVEGVTLGHKQDLDEAMEASEGDSEATDEQ